MRSSRGLVILIVPVGQLDLGGKAVPIRFAVTKSNSEGYHCELGILTELNDISAGITESIFDFVPREVENTIKFNTVFLVPTGIGCEVGGHAGDAGPTARLLAGACDTLKTHPHA